MVDLDDLTVERAAALLAARELSAGELVEATLERIAVTEPAVNAYAHVAAASAREAAERADREPPRGPLHGIPFGIKDVFDTRDAPTEAGSAVLAGRRPRRDATVVRRLREAGAILVGKHVTHEFASGQNTPPTRNPWRLDRYPGGSSVGGGASVAVGSCLLGVGSDAGGSVRKPACVSGVVGFKPTFGRVSGAGVVAGATVPSVDHVGLFTRTAADAALVLQVVAGADAGDPRTARVPPLAALPRLDASLHGVRLAIPRLDRFGDAPDAEVAVAFEAALGVLRELGAELTTIDLPAMRLALPAALTIIAIEMAPSHRRRLTESAAQYTAATRQFLEFATLAPVAHLEAALRAQARIRAELRDAVRAAGVDGLVLPTLPRTAPRMDELDPARDMPRLVQYTCPWSLVGVPAISVPAGLAADGLPVGLQLVGRPCDELTVLHAAHAYQTATDWHERRPPAARARAGASASNPHE